MQCPVLFNSFYAQLAADAIGRIFEQKVAVGETLPEPTGKVISLADHLAAKKNGACSAEKMTGPKLRYP